MNNFIFENTTKVYFGSGCVKEYLACLTAKYGDRIMLCYGGGSIKKNGIYDEVTEKLKSAGKTVFEFPGIMANPTYKKVLEGAEFARENGIDFTPLPLGVIVTVAGTGSECNGGSVITNEELRVKTGRDYPLCNPEFALLDPEYTYSVPKFQMVSGGFDTLSHMMEIYFSEPDEDNVSDDIAEALMKNVIRNLRVAVAGPNDYTARSNLMWDAVMAENRIIKLGKKTDFECHQMEHQLGAYTDCNHGAGLAVLHPVYYRHIYENGIPKFKRFAVNVWGIPAEGKSDEEIAGAGVEALADFIKEIGLPTTLQELGIDKTVDLKEIADSCAVVPGSYKKMTHLKRKKIVPFCTSSGSGISGSMKGVKAAAKGAKVVKGRDLTDLSSKSVEKWAKKKVK